MKSSQPLSGLVAADFAAKKPADAVARVQARVAATPNDPALLMLAARTYASAGDAAAMERSLRAAIAADPSQMEAYSLLGRHYLSQGKLDAAMKEFEAITARQPKAVGALTMIGMIHGMQGRKDEARRSYERALAIDPSAGLAANNLAWLMAELGEDLDTALDYARRAKLALPDRPEADDTLGVIYLKKKRPLLAVKAFRDAIAADPKNPIYHYRLGEAYAMSGDQAAAKAELQTALKLKPDFEGAAEARRLLAGM